MTGWRSYGWQIRSLAGAVSRRGRAWWRDEHGASAVEFALVSPLLITMLLGVIQYGSVFLVQMRMNDTARDTVRRLAVGDLSSETAAEDYARMQLSDWPALFHVVADLPTGYAFVVDDGTGPVEVFVATSAGFNPLDDDALAVGRTVSVVGVVARVDGTIEVLPRFATDINPPTS